MKKIFQLTFSFQSVFFILVLLLGCCKKDDPIFEEIEASSAEFYKSSFSLVVGGREKMMVSTEPVNAYLSNAQWYSSDTTVAKVDSLGIVKACSVGEALISVTANNNITGECSITVIESPISGLEMPNARNPIAKDAQVFILGSGFTENSKIYFRPHSDFKSVTDDDILAEISELSLYYISLDVKLNPGWYDIVLEVDDIEYELGNIEVETPNLSEYEYDANKIFWEDTHWRRFQLRGKVKKVDIAQEEWYTSYTHNDSLIKTVFSPQHCIYTFNENGYLISKNNYHNQSHSALFGFSFEYDSKNRVIKRTMFHSDGSYFTMKFTYGTHGLYCRSYDLFPPIDNIFGHTDGRCSWTKNIESLTSTSSSGDISTTTFTASANSMKIQKESTAYTITYPKDSKFPSSMITNYRGSTYTTTYEFSDVGIPLISDESENFYFAAKMGAPFYLLSNTSKYTYKYDNNWNIVEIFYEGASPRSFHYTSYDDYGNWTGCTIVKIGKFGELQSIHKTIREMSYWD